MAAGVIRLYRSPLREGESLYALSNIDQGRYMDGPKKDEKKPKRQSVIPEILEDGRMVWEMMDTEANRTFCVSFLPQTENPPFAYSVSYPEDEISDSEEVEVEADAGAPIVKRGRGRPKAGQ